MDVCAAVQVNCTAVDVSTCRLLHHNNVRDRMVSVHLSIMDIQL